MRATVLFLSSFVVLPTLCLADGYGPREIGTLLGSEAYCGLAYDPERLSAWVAASPEADSPDFTGIVDAHASMEAYRQADRSSSAKILHCGATAKQVEALGLLKKSSQ